MSRTSFRIAGLATLALTGSLVFAGPAAYADSASCEIVPTEDIITTIVHPAVVRTVPAVTHTEWAWERDVSLSESEFTRLVAAASLEVDWTREVPGQAELRFARIVLDQAAVPAVPGTSEVGHTEVVVLTPAVVETEDEYQHETTGKVRWERSDWGAQNGDGKGWKKTGATREVETTPAVTAELWVTDVPAVTGTPGVEEQSHVEEAWALASPGADWVATGESRPGVVVLETATTNGAAPSGDEWREVARREAAAVIDTVWAVEAPEGYSPTGSVRIASVTHELLPGTSAAAPAGDGWSAVAGSETVVTDVAAYDEVVTELWIEMLLSPPKVSEDCESPSEEVDGPSDEVEAPSDEVAGPRVDEAVVGQVLGQATAAATPTVLPNVGNGAPGWMAPTGLGSLLAGAVVALGARRRSVR